MKNLSNLPHTKTAAFDALDPLIAFCGAHRGSIAEVHRKFNERLQSPVTRSQFEKWLIADRERRVEPAFGAGLILLAISGELSRTKRWKDWSKKVDKKSRPEA